MFTRRSLNLFSLSKDTEDEKQCSKNFRPSSQQPKFHISIYKFATHFPHFASFLPSKISRIFPKKGEQISKHYWFGNEQNPGKEKVRNLVFHDWHWRRSTPRCAQRGGTVGSALKDTVGVISAVGFHNGRGNGRNSSENIRECQWSRQPNVV